MDKFCKFMILPVVCIILIWVYNKWQKRNRARKVKRLKTSSVKAILGFEDLPKLKSWIPLKLIGNVPQLFPLNKCIDKLLQFSQEYGDVYTGVGLNQRFVVLNSATSIQALLKSSDFGHVVKPPVAYGPMKPYVTNGILVSKGEFWQNQRKIITKTQNFQCLKAYVPMIEVYSKQLVQNLENVFNDGEPHEVIEHISTTFLGISNEMITGKRLDNLDILKEYHHNFTIWKEVMSKRTLNPLLLLKPIWMFHPLYEPHENALKGLSNFSKKTLSEYKLQANERHDMKKNKQTNPSLLDEFVNAGVNDEQILDEINTMMFGGHGSGSCATHFLCFCMALNPQFQEHARQEIDKFFEDPEALQDGHMTYESVQTNLKYLERCILETMRLYPPAFVLARQLEAPLTIEYKNKPVLIPEGVIAVICQLTLQRRKEVYPEPDIFNPDRFTPEECAKRHAYSYLPFSAGPRNCLGQKLAMIELKIVAAYIFRNFEVETTSKLDELELLPYITIAPAKNFLFRFKKRALIK